MVPGGALGTQPSPAGTGPPRPPPGTSGLGARCPAEPAGLLVPCPSLSLPPPPPAPPRKSRPLRAGRFPARDHSGDAGSPRSRRRCSPEKRGPARLCRTQPEAAQPLASPQKTPPGPGRVWRQQSGGRTPARPVAALGEGAWPKWPIIARRGGHGAQGQADGEAGGFPWQGSLFFFWFSYSLGLVRSKGPKSHYSL